MRNRGCELPSNKFNVTKLKEFSTRWPFLLLSLFEGAFRSFLNTLLEGNRIRSSDVIGTRDKSLRQLMAFHGRIFVLTESRRRSPQGVAKSRRRCRCAGHTRAAAWPLGYLSWPTFGWCRSFGLRRESHPSAVRKYSRLPEKSSTIYYDDFWGINMLKY